MKKQAKDIGVNGTAHETINDIINCTERGRNCLGKFIRTRAGQENVCIKCLIMLNDEVPPMVKRPTGKRNYWS